MSAIDDLSDDELRNKLEVHFRSATDTIMEMIGQELLSDDQIELVVEAAIRNRDEEDLKVQLTELLELT